MSNRDFYVYIDWRLDTNEPFYIGKGKGNRWRDMNGRNDHFKNIENSVPIMVEIVKDNLTEDEALGIECYLIHELVFEYGFSIDIKNNRGSDGDWLHLASATWGGEGTSGYKFSEESIDRISGENNHGATKVVLLNTLEIFGTIKYGAEKYKCDESSITKCCKGNSDSCGQLEDGTRLVWRYYEDYLKMTQEEINEAIRNVDSRIILLNTLEIFDTMVDGANKYNCIKSNISQCCNNIYNSCGKLEDGTRLVWMFYQDYLKMTKEEIDNKLKKAQEGTNGANNGNSTKVILLNTLEIFNTMTEGANKYKISSANISSCCSKSIKSCGKLEDGTPLVWKYYEDYLKMTQEEIREIIKSVDKRIILLNTLEVFASSRKGAKEYGTYATSINQCCNGKAKSSGKDKNGTPLVWMFYVDYLEQNNNNNNNNIA